MKRVAIYARVSTDKQQTSNQVLVLKEIAERSGYNIIQIYEDKGISGSKGREDRPALNQMMKDATHRKFDMVMCWSIDRLGRSISHLIEIMNELNGLKIDMFFSQQMAFELSSGFRDTIRTLTEQAESFQKPVLLLNGDSHRLVIDQPLKTTNTKHVLENVIRLQTMGDNQVQAVVVEVDESKEQPFTFRPLITKSTRPY